MKWSVQNLNREATGISASRRTDIPGLFGKWFANRLEAGWVEYLAPSNPRRSRSILPQDVTHFNFWSKWPRPFFQTQERVLDIGYPVVWNVTLTDLGSTEVEPKVPPTEKVLESIIELSRIVRPEAILWRFDPLFISEHYPTDFHLQNFTRLVDKLAGHVDRVTTSFVIRYGRQTEPDLKAYENETGDRLRDLSLQEQLDIVGRLKDICEPAGIPFTLCCSPEVRQGIGCPRGGCNNWDWLCRVYPELRQHRRLKAKPTRPDCGCSEETDIGVYNTCIFGCRYSYGSCRLCTALKNFERHDPNHPCILPPK